jgi:predicted acyltransferase
MDVRFPGYRIEFHYDLYGAADYSTALCVRFFVGGLASKCSETVGAVIYDIGYIVLCWLFLYFLYRKNTFLKV